MELNKNDVVDKEFFSQKKVILADVDETICETCHVVEEKMAKVIDSLIAKGFMFAFISGTEPKYMREMISSKLRQKHFLLPTTGTVCLEMSYGQEHSGQEHYRYQLSDEERKEIIAALRELTKEFSIQSLTTVEDQIQDRGTQIVLSAIGRNAPLDKKKVFDPDAAKRKVWIRYLRSILGDEKYEINYAGTTSIDITKKGLDKAWGIKKFAEYFSIPLSSILFIGDKTQPGGNDYPATTVVDFLTVKNPEETFLLLSIFERNTSLTDHRPWGKFEQYTFNEPSTVKILTLLPHQRLSLQSHQQREELWVALDDDILVEIDGKQQILKAGDKAFIPKGAKHRLSSLSGTTRVMEIAYGTFDEQDITRYEDDFGRVQ